MQFSTLCANLLSSNPNSTSFIQMIQQLKERGTIQEDKIASGDTKPCPIHSIWWLSPPPYLSTFFQSKLCRMTTGGASGAAWDDGVVPDRQGDVNTQHKPSAQSETVKREKYEVILFMLTTHWTNVTLQYLHSSPTNEGIYGNPCLTVNAPMVNIRHPYLTSCYVSKMLAQSGKYTAALIRNRSILSPWETILTRAYDCTSPFLCIMCGSTFDVCALCHLRLSLFSLVFVCVHAPE